MIKALRHTATLKVAGIPRNIGMLFDGQRFSLYPQLQLDQVKKRTIFRGFFS
jgi:hypothetical protein